MKIFLLSVIVPLCFNISEAQTIPASENISLDQQLSNIPQTSVTSGIIYERVLPVANLYNYNTTTAFNTANYAYFRQALSEMHSASNNTKFISSNALKALVENTSDNEVDIAILNTKYSVLNYNEDSPALGGLTYNNSTNKFASIPGKVPFFEKHNTVIAPIKDYSSGTKMIFKIRSDLFFTNGSKTIKTLIADFGDGINRNIITNSVLNNQNFTIPYNSSGEKSLKFTITYNDNSTLITYGKIYFHFKDPAAPLTGTGLAPSPACSSVDPLRQDFVLQADIPFTGYKPDDPTIKAKIEYRIFYAYAHVDKKVRKPIIIIDGFDPGDKRKIDDCDCANIPECAAQNITDGQYDPNRHKAMVDLMTYYNGATQLQLLNTLRMEGYDVILVNHPTYTTTNLKNGRNVVIDGGAYYIESNAMALIKLLQQTQTLLTASGSINKISIVGPSMGGQISRYALAYMEKHHLPHKTNLWISVDSPHLGANILMGDQALIYLLKEGGVDAAANFYDNELSSPAAQQQLIDFHRPGSNYHTVNSNLLNAQTTSQNMSLNRGNPVFQQHYNNHKNNGLSGTNGWPKLVRKIALVNGSMAGSKETVTPNGQPYISFPNDGEKILNLRGFQRVNINLPIGSITFRVHIASLEAHSMPSYGSESRIARFKKLLTDKTTKASNSNLRGNLDAVPGGYFDAQATISDATTSQDPVPGITLTSSTNWNANAISIENIFKSISEILGGSEWYRHEYNPVHSFIPTFSAIAHLQPNQSWSNPLTTNLTCSTKRLTNFDSYYGISKNTQHTSFTKESVAWLLKELAGQAQAPVYPLNENALSGPSHICANANSLFSFNDLCTIPSAVMFNGASGWSVEGPLTIISSSDYEIVVKATSQFYATAKIIAKFTNGNTYSKTITVGRPSAVGQSIAGSDSQPKNTSTSYSIAPNSTATQYYWAIEPVTTNCGCTTNNQGLITCPPGIIFPKFSQNNSSTLTTTNTSVIVNWGNCKGNYVLRCSAINSCGLTEISSKWVTIYDANSNPNNPQPCKYGIKIAPNPIKDGNINVTFGIVNPYGPPCGVEDDYFNGQSKIFDVKLYDFSGQVVYQNSYNETSFTISNLNFKRGHYILDLITDTGVKFTETFVME